MLFSSRSNTTTAYRETTVTNANLAEENAKLKAQLAAFTKDKLYPFMSRCPGCNTKAATREYEGARKYLFGKYVPPRMRCYCGDAGNVKYNNGGDAT